MFLNKKQIIFLFASALILFISAVSFFTRGTTPELFGGPTVTTGGAGQELRFPVSGSDRDSEIRDLFRAYLQSDIPDGSWTSFADSANSVTPGRFLRALDGDINSSLEVLLDPQELQLYTCIATSQSPAERDVVFSVRFALQENYQGDFYQDQLQALRSWEQTLVNDIQPVLFPNQVLASADNPPIAFADVEDEGYTFFRTATVMANDGQELSVYYMMIGDEVMVGSDKDCLLQAQQLLFDLTS